MNYNLYCDESNHLLHSENNIMTLGYVSCERDKIKKTNYELRQLKEEFNLNKNYELKWTKVSKGKIDYFKEVVNYFFENVHLSFRVIVADKSELNHSEYNLSHDDWYYRMYYLLLGKTLDENNNYHIYLDIKDSVSERKIQKLSEVLSNSYYTFTKSMIGKIQHVRSDQVEILQVTDLLIGAVSYQNNKLNTSQAKIELIEHVQKLSGKSLMTSTYKNERKFNIFCWEASYYD